MTDIDTQTPPQADPAQATSNHDTLARAGSEISGPGATKFVVLNCSRISVYSPEG